MFLDEWNQPGCKFAETCFVRHGRQLTHHVRIAEHEEKKSEMQQISIVEVDEMGPLIDDFGSDALTGEGIENLMQQRNDPMITMITLGCVVVQKKLAKPIVETRGVV